MTTYAEPSPRRRLLKTGLLLAGGTILWNIVEGVIAVASGVLASSVALIGFGIDSFIETTSAAVIGWRLWRELRDAESDRAELIEKRAARIAGGLLLILAAYLTIDAGRRLLGFGSEANETGVGLALTAVSLVVMPLLGQAKLRVGAALESRALRADAHETLFCAWLSLTTLIGLGLNVWWGWSWADPAAALILVPFIVREGLEGWRGEECGCGG
jgi:divalent metal cation (Fe/Co/Zn/Cd) transporter